MDCQQPNNMPKLMKTSSKTWVPAVLTCFSSARRSPPTQYSRMSHKWFDVSYLHKQEHTLRKPLIIDSLGPLGSKSASSPGRQEPCDER